MRMLRHILIVGLTAASVSLASPSASGAGADILMGSFGNTVHFGPIGGIHAYSLGSFTCNVSSDAGLSWISSGTPGFAMNAYRLHNGRFIQIGMGNCKTACCVSNFTDSVCGTTCTAIGVGLRAGCRDHYDASWNSGQSRLAPRSKMDPQTGVILTNYPTSLPNQNSLTRRLQINQNDITAASFPGALWFAESQYICTEDAVARNDMNNASYQRVTFDASFNMVLQSGAFVAGQPAIYAWRANGGGAGVIDPAVTITAIDIPGEGTISSPRAGRYYLASKVTDNGDGTWRYEYALQNFNSDRGVAGFRVPTAAKTSITDFGFHAPDYHSDDALLYSNADWQVPVPRPSHEIGWTTESFAQNANASALRWGTMYNYWFVSNSPPVDGQIELDVFKPGVGECVPARFRVNAPAPALINAADVVRNGSVDVDDLIAVILGWGECACPYTCDADVVDNNAVDVDDLVAVILSWG